MIYQRQITNSAKDIYLNYKVGHLKKKKKANS